MSFKKLVEGMSLRDRRVLHESIKSRILLEEQTASWSAADAPVGTSLMKGNKEVFRKTQQGWKATVRITAAQVLGLVKPDARDEVKKGLDKLGQGDEYPIMKGSLIDPELAGESGEVTFQREGDMFADPRVVQADVINTLKSDQSLTEKEGTQSEQTGTQGSSTVRAVGDALITIFTDGTIKITVKDDGSGTYRGFEDIFGQDSGIVGKIQSAVGKKNPNALVFKLADATEGSLLQQMSKNVFRGLGIGKVRFERDKPGVPYVAKINGGKRADKIRDVLDAMKDKGQAI
jgi:hypothetical protein